MTNGPALTAARFDRLVSRDDTDIIWTAPAIGKHIGRSAAYVRRTLATAPQSPIHRHGRGNLYAFKRDLDAWLTAQRAA